MRGRERGDSSERREVLVRGERCLQEERGGSETREVLARVEMC